MDQSRVGDERNTSEGRDPQEKSALLELLPDDLLARCLEHVTSADLTNVEKTCRRLKRVVEEQGLWRHLCLKKHRRMWPEPPEIDTSELTALPFASDPSRAAHVLSFAHKRLHHSLSLPTKQHSLLADALVASSTDHPEEGLSNVLNPVTQRLITGHIEAAYYWSSTGSESDEHNESITFRLVHPVCLVTAIQLRPFMAWFQAPKNPIYAPKSIRIRIGGIQCFDRSGQPKILQECCKAAEADLLTDDAKRAAHAFADHTLQSGTSTSPPSLSSSLDSNITLELTSGERLRRGPVCSATERGTWDGWQWISPELPVEKVDELQTFRIPPTVCLGGYLRIDLIGKTETQDIDERFYTCISYVRCLGKPLYHFTPSLSPPGSNGTPGPSTPTLKVVLDDPLLDAGGLVAVSETGWPPEGYDLGLPEVGMYLPVHGLLGFEDDGNWLMEQALEFEMDQYAAEYGEGFDDDDFDDDDAQSSDWD